MFNLFRRKSPKSPLKQVPCPCSRDLAAKSIYRGFRKDNECHVEVNGSPLSLYHDHYDRSNGFEWGYVGAGPSQLAFCILYDHLRDRHKAFLLQEAFKKEYTTRFDRNADWVLTSAEIENFIERRWTPAKEKERKYRMVVDIRELMIAVGETDDFEKWMDLSAEYAGFNSTEDEKNELPRLRKTQYRCNGDHPCVVRVNYVIIDNICYFSAIDKGVTTINVAEDVVQAISKAEKSKYDTLRYVDIQARSGYTSFKPGQYEADEIIFKPDQARPVDPEWHKFELPTNVYKVFKRYIEN